MMGPSARLRSQLPGTLQLTEERTTDGQAKTVSQVGQ
jgi:hypothetical protein